MLGADNGHGLGADDGKELGADDGIWVGSRDGDVLALLWPHFASHGLGFTLLHPANPLLTQPYHRPQLHPPTSCLLHLKPATQLNTQALSTNGPAGD